MRAEASYTSSRVDFHRRTALMKACETANEFIIAIFLLDHGRPATRGEIVQGTPVKWTTTYDSLVRLHAKGIVNRKVVSRSRGRPVVLWSLND